jgi:hypothetical protein
MLLEGMNDHLPAKPRDLSDMMRDLAFRNTVVHSQTALALIAAHPDEPAAEMVSLALHAVAQCRGTEAESDAELRPLPPDTTSDGLLAIYRQMLAILLEDVNEKRPPPIGSFGDILAHADVRKRYIGPFAALLVVIRCGRVPSSTIAQFALDAAMDSKACPAGGHDLICAPCLGVRTGPRRAAEPFVQMIRPIDKIVLS